MPRELNLPDRRKAGRRRSIRLGLCLAVTAAGIATAGDHFPGVRQLMSDEEFRATGLEKLSLEELEQLDAWLIRYTAGDAEVLRASNKAVRKAQKSHEIVARIEGDFRGWTGKTIFRLDNGQVWKQRLDSTYRYRGAANPQVRIERNWMGFYRMTVLGTGKSVGVSPLH